MSVDESRDPTEYRTWDQLIEKVKHAAQSPGQATTDGHPSDVAFTPLTVEEIERAEANLGFPITGLLRRLYLEVGNGGFGPGYGLLPLVSSAAVPNGKFVTLFYRQFRNQTGRIWNEKILPFSSWGSGVLSCVNLSGTSDADPQVYRFEPNMPESYTHRYLHGFPFIGTGLVPEQRTLSQWLAEWLDGRAEEMFERLNQI